MKLYPNTKVYIQCPANVQTGGPESLHQLALQLISLGIPAYMFYYKLVDAPFNKEDPVHDAYKKYHVPYTNRIEDNSKNIMIISETSTEALYDDAKYIRRVLWWMSVNNYLENTLFVIKECLQDPLSKPMRNYFTFHDAEKNFERWGQSNYVHQFLKLNGVKKIQNVETHMSQTFLSRAKQIDLSKKENIVAYNPNKGFEVVKLFITAAPDIDWRPIKDMTPAQVQDLLSLAKVYIDFGKFPGRERLPREAILSGCVVIVGKRGAASNDVDINIPAEFKFDLEGTTPQDVINKIREVFKNFAEAHAAQKAFRDKELNAQKNFIAQIAVAFGIKKTNRESIALPQGFKNGTSSLIEKLRRKSLMPSFIVDDMMSTAEMAKLSEGLIIREQNRNYMRFDDKLIEIITRDDAKFLYLEGRIKKFALLEPSETELTEVKDFYGADVDNLMIFSL